MPSGYLITIPPSNFEDIISTAINWSEKKKLALAEKKKKKKEKDEQELPPWD